MEIFINILIIVGVVIVLLSLRFSQCKSRLQKCIDNGTIIFDGITITIPDELDDKWKMKLELEREFYLKYTRTFQGIGQLHLKNSQY